MSIDKGLNRRFFCCFLIFLTAFAARSADKAGTVRVVSSPEKAPPFTLYRPQEEPFWRAKKSVRKRMVERNEVIVSVTSDERKEGKKELEQLFLKGAGMVKVPLEFAWRKIHEFEKLQTLSPDHFEQIRHDKKKNQLYIHGKALGWHAKMYIMLYDLAEKDKRTYQMHWHIYRGSFKGMTGQIQVREIAGEDQGRRRTEFSMTAFYESEKLPLPQILLSFGLETVLKAVAHRMRRFLQGEYREEHKIEH